VEIVLMLWFYLSGLALLVGAELNAERTRPAPQAHTASRRATKIGPAADVERNGGREDRARSRGPRRAAGPLAIEIRRL
jgi:hypothetical protein